MYLSPDCAAQSPAVPSRRRIITEFPCFTDVMKATSPFFWYRLDDAVPAGGSFTLADSSGNGFTCGGVNNSAFNNWISHTGLLVGDADKALDKVGTNNVINQFGAVALTGWGSGNQPCTFFAVINSPLSNFANVICAVGMNGTGNEIAFLVIGAGGGAANGQVQLAIQSLASVGTTVNIAPNTTHVLVGEYDGSTVNLWIDNVLSGSGAMTGLNLVSANPDVWLFNDANWLADGWLLQGIGDEIAGWNRLLSASERTNLYLAATR